MARRRFIADEVHGSTAVLLGQNAVHLARVLRAKVGQEFEVAAKGIVRLGTITSLADGRVEFELRDEVGATVVNRPFPTEEKDRAPIRSEKEQIIVTLVVAIFKFDRFEWAVEKATELGVAGIVPVIARRTDAHLAQAATKRVDRWRRIAHEASQQSRRVTPPQIGEPIKLKDVLAIEAELRILCAESEQLTSLRDVIDSGSAAADVHSVAIAVGPEGGWTDDELKLFESAGWTSASLGPTILRAETAVVAALAIAQSMMV